MCTNQFHLCHTLQLISLISAIDLLVSTLMLKNSCHSHALSWVCVPTSSTFVIPCSLYHWYLPSHNYIPSFVWHSPPCCTLSSLTYSASPLCSVTNSIPFHSTWPHPSLHVALQFHIPSFPWLLTLPVLPPQWSPCSGNQKLSVTRGLLLCLSAFKLHTGFVWRAPLQPQQWHPPVSVVWLSMLLLSVTVSLSFFYRAGLPALCPNSSLENQGVTLCLVSTL